MSDRKLLINKLTNHPGNTDVALRNHLLTHLDKATDLEAEAKAFYAPKKKVAKKKVAKKKVAKKKVAKKQVRKKTRRK